MLLDNYKKLTLTQKRGFLHMYFSWNCPWDKIFFQFKDLGPIVILLMAGFSMATSTDIDDSREEGSRQGKVCKCD